MLLKQKVSMSCEDACIEDIRGHCGSRCLKRMRECSIHDSNHDLHYKDHLLLQLPTLVILRANFPVKVQQFLELFVLGRHNKLDNGHH